MSTRKQQQPLKLPATKKEIANMKPTTPTTAAQAKAAIGILTAVADTIRELKEVPSGHLYARVMGHLSLAQYEQVIGVLKGAGLIRVENHLISWVG
jgi:hypothetical protein